MSTYKTAAGYERETPITHDMDDPTIGDRSDLEASMAEMQAYMRRQEQIKARIAAELCLEMPATTRALLVDCQEHLAGPY